MGKENRHYGQTRGGYPLLIHNTESEAAKAWRRDQNMFSDNGSEKGDHYIHSLWLSSHTEILRSNQHYHRLPWLLEGVP